MATIVIQGNDPISPIESSVMGSDYLAIFDGMGSFDPDTSSFYSSFLNELSGSTYAGSLRFPGGITAQTYQWKRAIGPQSQRKANPAGPNEGPSPSGVGPDEFGALLDATGASGIVTVNFDTSTATSAAEFVQYMTGAPGSSRWADRRVADGHRAPYGVPVWEVGNEEMSDKGWREGTLVGSIPSGCRDVAVCEYIYGGSTRFSDERVVGFDDRTAAASVSRGTADQSFYVAYPPVAPRAVTISVGGVRWTRVTSLDQVGSASQAYTLQDSTGEIRFGDGVHGAIPAKGAAVTASYVSGPHQGFLQFYQAMKKANPHIEVCASDTSLAFVEAMGSRLHYDCLDDHPYVVGVEDLSSLGQYEHEVMLQPAGEYRSVAHWQKVTKRYAGHAVPIVLTEYGSLLADTPEPLQDPYYFTSLDEALVNASQLANWIDLGIDVADRQLLTGELPPPSLVARNLPGGAPYSTTSGIVGPGPDTVVEPTGEYFELFKPIAGGELVASTTSGDPVLATDGTETVGDLSVVGASRHGSLYALVINRSPTDDVPAAIDLRGFEPRRKASVMTLDGPTALSYNTAASPSVVSTTTSSVDVENSSVDLVLPAHSISLLTFGSSLHLAGAQTPTSRSPAPRS